MCAGAISNFHKVNIKVLSAYRDTVPELGQKSSTLMDIQPFVTMLLECYRVHNIDFSDSNTDHPSSEDRALAKHHK